MRIETLVNKLVKKYNTRNPFEIADYLGIIVILIPLQGIKGMYQYFQRNSIIYINSFLSDNERNIVCTHELGHAILHKKTNSTLLNLYSLNNITNKFEKEANEFASYLLLGNYDKSEIQEYSTKEIVKMTGLSEDAIIKFVVDILHRQSKSERMIL